MKLKRWVIDTIIVIVTSTAFFGGLAFLNFLERLWDIQPY